LSFQCDLTKTAASTLHKEIGDGSGCLLLLASFLLENSKEGGEIKKKVEESL
jgi:hypothetical protein